MLGRALFQAGSALRPPHPTELCWVGNEFLLGSGIPAPERNCRSRAAPSPRNSRARCSFPVGNFPSSASPSSARIWWKIHPHLMEFHGRSIQICGDSVSDPSKFMGVPWQIHPNLLRFHSRSVQICWDSVVDPSKFMEILWQIHPNSLGFCDRSIQIYGNLLEDPSKFTGIPQQIHANLWGFCGRSIQTLWDSVVDPSRFAGIQWWIHPNSLDLVADATNSGSPVSPGEFPDPVEPFPGTHMCFSSPAFPHCLGLLMGLGFPLGLGFFTSHRSRRWDVSVTCVCPKIWRMLDFGLRIPTNPWNPLGAASHRLQSLLPASQGIPLELPWSLWDFSLLKEQGMVAGSGSGGGTTIGMRGQQYFSNLFFFP